MNELEKLLEHIINGEEEKADDIFHNFVVSSSRKIYESLIDEDDLEEMRRDHNEYGGDEADDFIDDIQADETGLSMEDEEEDGDMEMGMDDGDDGMGMDYDGDDTMGGDVDPEADLEDRIVDVEDALAELEAEFDKIMGDDDEMDMDGDMDDMGGDMDMDSEYADDEGMDDMDDMGENRRFESKEVDEDDEVTEEDQVDEEDEVTEEDDLDESIVREYVNTVSDGHGAEKKGKAEDGGTYKKSPVAKSGKGSISTGHTDEKGMTPGKAKEENAGNVNVPGANASKSNSNDSRGHGAEKKGKSEDGGVNKKSPLGS